LIWWRTIAHQRRTDAAKRVFRDVADEKTRVASGLGSDDFGAVRLVGRQQEFLNALRSRPVLMDPTATFGSAL
jgi:exodeoxyribonuclease VII large subunit